MNYFFCTVENFQYENEFCDLSQCLYKPGGKIHLSPEGSGALCSLTKSKKRTSLASLSISLG